MYAMRVWKSDGSVNIMGVDIAAKNLKSFAVDEDIRKMRQETIADKLLEGELIETRLANFSLYR